MADHAVVADDEVDLSRRKFLTRATIATGAVGAVSEQPASNTKPAQMGKSSFRMKGSLRAIVTIGGS